jgi:hypothetical protein
MQFSSYFTPGCAPRLPPECTQLDDEPPFHHDSQLMALFEW